MYLKTLTVRGFKSFASATTFEFEPGVTAVVGPNGSGKSNVVDALAWVMGEQGAKTLRGGKMEDVIFAGTSARPALGRAQVSLTIDNSDGALPIEYSEVTISRTLFRSGGSEYAINSSPCRLLDIQELLSDSGLGREMHVIVGQGQLDRILRATPEERRGFIEEAAGILKHRRRKEKTLRKLDAMQANLARLEDLTGEIAKQLKPLGRQADTARRARTVQATLRDARSRLLADDLCALEDDTRSAAEERAELQSAITKAQAVVEESSDAVTSIERRAADAAPVAVRARETWYALTRLQERYRALINLAAERRRLLGTPDESHRPGDDPDELDSRAADLQAEAEEAQHAMERLASDLDSAHEARADAEAAQRTEDARLTAVLRAVADRREGLARLAGEVGTARQRLESAQGERVRAQESGEEARKRAAEADRDLVQARAVADDAATSASGPSKAVAQSREEVQALREDLRTARAEVAPLAEARAGLESRVETLGESIPPEHGTGSLLDGVEAGLLGVLAERLRVAQGAEAAVAAALMGAQSALITADTDVLERVAQAAANGVDGNVWLLNRLQESRSSNSVQLPPGAAWVIDSVDCEEADRAVVSGLLDGTVLAEDDVQAQALVTDLHVTAVTRQGHRWDEHGLRIGAGDTSSLAKRAKLEQAEYELRSAQEAEEKARSEYARVEPLLTEAQARLKTLEEEARNTAEASRKAAAEVNRLESLSRQATAEAERAEAGVERTGAAVSQATQQLDELDLRLENAQAVPAEEEPSTDERDRLAKVAEAARAHEMQTRLDLRAAEEADRRRTERIKGLKRAAARERQARFQAELRARRRAQQAQRAERVAELATAAEGRLHDSVRSAQAALKAAEAQQRRLSAHLEVARGALNRAKEEVTRLNDSAHAGEVLAAERAARLENLQERILEEVGMTPEYLLEHFGPQLPVPVEDDPNDRWAALRVEVDEDGNPVSGVPYDRAEQEKRLKRAEKDLAALGKINPLALEEFAALEERHTYLTGQLDDLKSSRADLLDLVRQVDEHVREVFSSAYEETAVEFKRIFGRLFPGGEGELVLTEPEDMLTTGIEVHARPAGKKVKRLSLLSGGERSLTAIAMLVAIFTARPSPFYVMDEVEAALDERNLLRLLGVFSDLREHSQLIIITHQKHTMDIADALYGVSMRGDGITQVISQKVGGHEGSPT